jgi:hypothetical protein
MSTTSKIEKLKEAPLIQVSWCYTRQSSADGSICRPKLVMLRRRRMLERPARGLLLRGIGTTGEGKMTTGVILGYSEGAMFG